MKPPQRMNPGFFTGLSVGGATAGSVMAIVVSGNQGGDGLALAAERAGHALPGKTVGDGHPTTAVAAGDGIDGVIDALGAGRCRFFDGFRGLSIRGDRTFVKGATGDPGLHQVFFLQSPPAFDPLFANSGSIAAAEILDKPLVLDL